MKTTVKSPTEVMYNLPDTQMAYTREQPTGTARHSSSRNGQRTAAAAFAGAALLVGALPVLQLTGLAATAGMLTGLALAAFYYFAIKPILAMDFDISPANEELAQIIAELWD
ncbi:MAG: hypothetical protein H6559_29310 [Lewinellaceae bacterium]|nr:hypothetical protein [Lewinellaceae bacterium]